MSTLDLSADIIDVRDIIERAEEIESEICDKLGLDSCELGDIDLHDYARSKQDDDDSPFLGDDEIAEACTIRDLLGELNGMGGDEQWRGDWYPVTLIKESYFEDYARELADDIGAVSKDATWPNNCIDWEEAADMLKQDYSSLEIDGETYYTR